MTRTTITEHQRSLIQICFEIARDRFKAYAASSMPARACEQFARQAKEADELLMMFATADEITITGEAG